MLSKQDKNIVSVYLATIIVAAALVFVIINFDSWFFSDEQPVESLYTPVTRNTIGADDFKSDIFKRDTFRALGPMLTDQELKQLDTMGVQLPGGASGTITPTAKPKREVRRSNPFIPF
jgi:hypothetical protein